jgi:hypothetical protein
MRWRTLVMEVLIQLPCLMLGHKGIRERGAGEIFERCRRCRRRSPGWQLPARVAAGSRAATVARPPDRLVEAVFVGTLDDVMAQLAADAMAAGRDDEVQLLLAATDGRVH